MRQIVTKIMLPDGTMSEKVTFEMNLSAEGVDPELLKIKQVKKTPQVLFSLSDDEIRERNEAFMATIPNR